jgi:ankyrin repeat protein
MRAAMREIGLPEHVQSLLSEYFVETAGTLADPLLPFYHLPLDDLRALLEEDPAPATLSDHGRTLLRIAAREWDLERVQLLLEFGADVLARDALGHPALYHAANAQMPGRAGDGPALVALLIERGAEVNARSGPGRMTALHMAARRGSVDLAGALLAAGAEIEAKDFKGDTPLRRAVNCGQLGMVRLLMAHGADPLSKDARGRTPRDAARHKTIRQALENG